MNIRQEEVRLGLPFSLNLHQSMHNKRCAADVFHQLITCYDITDWGVTESATSWKDMEKKCGERSKKWMILWGFWLVLYYVLWVLFLNSGGYVCSLVPTLALVLSGMWEAWLWSQTRQTLWVVFSKQIWGFICCIAEWGVTRILALNQ